MFRGNLKPVIKGSILVFKLPALHRIMFFFTAFMLMLGVYFSPRNSENLWIPVLFAVLSSAGGIYSEKWIFDRDSLKVTYFIGIPIIPFLHKKTEFTFNDIAEFIIESPKHYRRKKETRFSAVLISGERYEIDSLPGESGEKILKENASLTAEFCGRDLKTP